MIAGPRIPFGTTAPVPRRIWYVLVAAAWLGTLIGFDTLRVHLQSDPLADVHAYYDAGARLNAGQPLYDQPAGTDDPSFYRYPPLLAILFVITCAFLASTSRMSTRRNSSASPPMCPRR